MRSIATKLILIALGVSLIQAGLTTWFAQRTASASFARFVQEELESDLIDLAEEHYARSGTLRGVDRVIAMQTENPNPRPDRDNTGRNNTAGDNVPPRDDARPEDNSLRNDNRPPTGNGGPPPNDNQAPGNGGLPPRQGPGPRPEPGGDPLAKRFAPFALVDADGEVLVPAGAFKRETVVSLDQRLAGTPIVAEDSTVGYLLVNPESLTLSNREQRFMSDLFRAVAVAALAGLGVAFILAALLSRRVVGALSNLTAAARRLAKGDLAQTVPVTSHDEIGVLAEAFNSMSHSLNQSQSLRRQMTADIAHDLRTPLTVLQGYLEAMSKGDLEPTGERIDLLYSEAKHLSRLVEDLRLLSLADAGELPLNIAEIRAIDLLKTVQAFLAREAKSNGISLVIEPQKRPVDVRADFDQLRRVLINLVSNAIRHTPSAGTITLSVTSDLDAESADTDDRNLPIHFRVSDTGDGIPEADVSNVFERFYRSDVARARTDDGGSGLGLAICKALVEAHDGHISVERTGEAGTTFRIDLPLLSLDRQRK